MTDITFTCCKNTVTVETIDGIESQLGCPLPRDYREFLLKHNGGTPHPKCYDVVVEGANFNSWINCFHSVDGNLVMPCQDAGGTTIAFNHFEYGNGVPKDCLIIGTSNRDDLLLLRLCGERRGHIDLKLVVDWDPKEETREDDIYPVAASFSGFLAMLHQ